MRRSNGLWKRLAVLNGGDAPTDDRRALALAVGLAEHYKLKANLGSFVVYTEKSIKADIAALRKAGNSRRTAVANLRYDPLRRIYWAVRDNGGNAHEATKAVFKTLKEFPGDYFVVEGKLLKRDTIREQIRVRPK